MAFLSGFLADIFISYSHIDNEPFGSDQFRWVSKFHNHLETRVHALLGESITIWRDSKNTGSDIFSDETIGQLHGSAILVSIVTPSYLASNWCRREFDEFVAPNGGERNIRLGNKSRIIKVLKTPVPRPKLPAILDAMLGYEFYRREPDTGSDREFLLDPGPDGIRLYFAKVDDVAHEIFRLIGLMAASSWQNGSVALDGMALVTPPSDQIAVYLAAASSDIQSHTDQIRRELEDRGYAVLPEKPLPESAEEITELVRHDLARSVLAIHAIGSRYGVVPEDEARSVVEIQYDLSLENSSANFTSVVWIPPGPATSDERLQKLLMRIRGQQEGPKHLEILETSIERLKNFLLDRLNRWASAEKSTKTQRPRDQTSLRSVYLLYDKSDDVAVTPVHQYLDTEGLEVIPTLMSGAPQELREDHQESLRIADGVLIYWGAASGAWLRAKLRDLIRIRGAGRTTPFRARGVYVDAPSAQEKQEFSTREVEVIHGQPERRCKKSWLPSSRRW
jgi:hypothetical protein